MTYANQEVLEFYKELPFNIFGDLNTAINQIKANDPFEVYPELKKIIGSKKVNILDIGCGGGWLVNSLCYHHNEQVKVVGVDYNPVVINYAKEIRDKLKLKSEFYVSDLFALDETRKYDLIISLIVPSLTCSSPSLTPFSLICLGSKKLLEILIFSSSV